MLSPRRFLGASARQASRAGWARGAAAVDPRPRPGGAVDRTRFGVEVVLVLAPALGQSAVYSVLRIIERLTRPQPLTQQTSTLNASVTPDRPWLDLTYQLVDIGFGLVPVLLALYLLTLTEGPPARVIGLDLRRPRFDLGRGALIAAGHRHPRTGSLPRRPRPRASTPRCRHPGWPTSGGPSRCSILSALQNALLEEVIMVGYLLPGCASSAGAVPIAWPQRADPRLVPPLPGLRRLRRQPDHGRDLRSDLPPLAARRRRWSSPTPCSTSSPSSGTPWSRPGSTGSSWRQS